MILKLTIYVSAIIFVLTGCGAIGGCAFSSAEIQNHTDKDIYVLIKFDTLYNTNENVDIFLRFSNTKFADFVGLDTIHNTETYRLKSKGNLTLYEGPGSEPKLFFQSLKIITEKSITEYKSPSEIAGAFEDYGIQNILIVE